jgi:predicted RNA binding protein with dsRBD fold (UPF0201 family)
VLFIVANQKLKNMDPISKSKLEEVLRSRGIFDRARIILSSSLLKFLTVSTLVEEALSSFSSISLVKIYACES